MRRPDRLAAALAVLSLAPACSLRSRLMQERALALGFRPADPAVSVRTLLTMWARVVGTR